MADRLVVDVLESGSRCGSIRRTFRPRPEVSVEYLPRPANLSADSSRRDADGLVLWLR